ncbi:MAG: membrane protein insertion efficiency factor YidD [Methylobacteriaceae bacterium]|nr:membrane protein insertion efficiency factor YidD [Methylobacteriaceae bacterium]MBV9243953.1 membrane protein insertion efficiency factor YidD [Methylobacteriaceae bacterium]MBV9637835.1 membrane protein insertion efficiency factor YidD [Methylobacteriaceae bacterium]MBV9701950.1 membrane protein insertion efficiency factor YidD [Methylobacteriaceae bacterium]
MRSTDKGKWLLLPDFRGLPRAMARIAIRGYQLTFSFLFGGQCRHLPTCSEYADAAVARHGAWAGAWMGLARICRCHPWGTAGYDPVPEAKPEGACRFAPWRYGRWRGPLVCDLVAPEADPGDGWTGMQAEKPLERRQDRAISSTASP